MPNMVQGFGPDGFQPSGGPQTMTAEEKLASMMQAMGGAPNSVLQMIARIFQNGQGGAAQAQPQPPQQWDMMYQMPPASPIMRHGVNPEPIRPSEPPRPLGPMNPGFIRG